MKVGVLALQGDFAEHCQSLTRSGAEAIEVRLPDQLTDLDGLIIPGGESTTIGKLIDAYGFIEPIRALRKREEFGHLCRRNFDGTRGRARASAAQDNGYSHRAQCLWQAN